MEPQNAMVFCSHMLRQEFARLYGLPPIEEVLTIASPPVSIPSQEERTVARDRPARPRLEGAVIGYLGGIQEAQGLQATHSRDGGCLSGLPAHGRTILIRLSGPDTRWPVQGAGAG